MRIPIEFTKSGCFKSKLEYLFGVDFLSDFHQKLSKFGLVKSYKVVNRDFDKWTCILRLTSHETFSKGRNKEVELRRYK